MGEHWFFSSSVQQIQLTDRCRATEGQLHEVLMASDQDAEGLEF